MNRDPTVRKYVIFDIETTGIYPLRGDRIIEIGAVAVRDGAVDCEFHSLINVPRRISRPAQRVHGITNGDLQNAPMPEQVFSEFQNFTRGCTLVAHNAVFDMSFLRQEFQRHRLILNHKSICTLKLSRRMFPELPDHKLQTVHQHLFKNEQLQQQHRALDDARMVAEIWREMGKK